METTATTRTATDAEADAFAAELDRHAEAQGLTPAYAHLDAHNLDHGVMNTGGWCMVIDVTLLARHDEGERIWITYEGEWLACHYTDDEDYEPTVIYEGPDAALMAAAVADRVVPAALALSDAEREAARDLATEVRVALGNGYDLDVYADRVDVNEAIAAACEGAGLAFPEGEAGFGSWNRVHAEADRLLNDNVAFALAEYHREVTVNGTEFDVACDTTGECYGEVQEALDRVTDGEPTEDEADRLHAAWLAYQDLLGSRVSADEPVGG